MNSILSSNKTKEPSKSWIILVDMMEFIYESDLKIGYHNNGLQASFPSGHHFRCWSVASTPLKRFQSNQLRSNQWKIIDRWAKKFIESWFLLLQSRDRNECLISKIDRGQNVDLYGSSFDGKCPSSSQVLKSQLQPVIERVGYQYWVDIGERNGRKNRRWRYWHQ